MRLKGRKMPLSNYPDDIDPESGCRLPLPRREDLDEAGRQTYDRAAAPGGNIAGLQRPAAVQLYSTRTTAHLQAINRYLRFEAGFSPRIREIAILTTAREMDSQFEWVAHENEEFGLRCCRRQQRCHPREGEIVGCPLTGDGAGTAREPGGIGGDLGWAEGPVGHVREVLALLVQVGAGPHPGVVGDELVPPAGAPLLHADAHEVGRTDRLGGADGRGRVVETVLPGSEHAQTVENGAPCSRGEPPERGPGQPGRAHRSRMP